MKRTATPTPGLRRQSPETADGGRARVAEADDDELMALVQQHDQAAFGRVLDRHLASVLRYLVRLTGSAADADELAQETFLRLWQRAGSYRPGTVKLTTWLHRIAHNVAVDELRRRRPMEPEPEETAAETSSNPDALAASGEIGRRLQAAIGALPANQRAALLLCQVQGFSNRESSAILGVTVRGVESLVARARRTLRETVLEQWEHDEQRERRRS